MSALMSTPLPTVDSDVRGLDIPLPPVEDPLNLIGDQSFDLNANNSLSNYHRSIPSGH